MTDSILFISPNKSTILNKDDNLVQKLRTNISLPGLTILGALEAAGHSCNFIDLTAENDSSLYKVEENLLVFGLSTKDTIEHISHVNPKYVLISSMFAFEQFNIDELVNTIKAKFSNIVIIIGGIQASVKPAWHFEKSNPDFLVLGDGEETIVELINELNRANPTVENIDGIVFKDTKGKLIKTSPRKKLKDLNRAWDYETVLKDSIGNYRYNEEKCQKHPIYSEQRISNLNTFTFYASRGCPMACEFCPSSNRDGTICRHMSSDFLFEQFLHVRKEFDVSYFSNQADTFAFHKEGILFLEKVKEYRNETGDKDFVFSNPNAFFLNQFFNKNKLNYDFIELLKDTGFNIITIAIETINQRFSKKINWNVVKQEQVFELCKIIKSLGMKVDLYMMYGFEEQTKDEFYKDISFANKVKPYADQVTWHGLTLLPGSEYYYRHVEMKHKEKQYRDLMRSGYALHYPIEEFNLSNVSSKILYDAVKPFGKSWQ